MFAAISDFALLLDIWFNERARRGQPMADLRLRGLVVDDREVVHIAALNGRPAADRAA
jgi:hypothetical protein